MISPIFHRPAVRALSPMAVLQDPCIRHPEKQTQSDIPAYLQEKESKMIMKEMPVFREEV